MFCGKCGTELTGDAVFCSKCGQRTKAGEDATEMADSAAAGKRFRSPWAVLFVVIVLAILVAGSVLWVVSRQNAARAEQQAKTAAAQAKALAEAKEAVDGVGKINAAVGVGVTYQNYMSLLSEAAAAGEAYQPKDGKGIGIKADLAKAVRYYSLAGTVWNDDIQGNFYGDTYKADSELRLRQEIYLTADRVRQAAWSVAGVSFDKARTALATYGAAPTDTNNSGSPGGTKAPSDASLCDSKRTELARTWGGGVAPSCPAGGGQYQVNADYSTMVLTITCPKHGSTSAPLP